MPADRTHSSTVETAPAHAASVALPPRVLSAFLDRVAIAARERPALVVMDLNMPEMNGYGAIAHLRRVPALSAMPVMVLTSEEGTGVETTVACFRRGSRRRSGD